MGLHFLNFDYSEDDEGRASWDAVASVAAARLPELVQEIVGLLAWAHAEFGALQGPAEDGGLWDYDLQYERDGHALQSLRYDATSGQLRPSPQALPDERVSLTLALSGGPFFADAFGTRYGAV
ncbi:MAG: hypothetical protein JSS01_08080 [Proteobacteria bacterium]|nr:hypothetical protein [Pseudomonadota bacterium]